MPDLKELLGVSLTALVIGPILVIAIWLSEKSMWFVIGGLFGAAVVIGVIAYGIRRAGGLRWNWKS